MGSYKCWKCGFWIHLDDVSLPDPVTAETTAVICAGCYHRHATHDQLPFPLWLYQELRDHLNGLGLWFTKDEPAVGT